MRPLRTHLASAALLVALAARAPAQEVPGPDAARRGQRLAQVGDVEGALRLLEARVARAPADDEARRALADLLTRADRTDEALALLEAGVAASVAPARLLARAGELALESGRVALAVAAFERAQALAPAPDAARGLARARMAQGDRPRALDALTTQRERGASAPLLVELGALLRGAGRDEASRLAFEDALALDPRSAAAHEALARACEREGQAREALDHRRRAAFHAWLPTFAPLEFDDEVYARFLRLTRADPTSAVAALGRDPSASATTLLVAFVWHHPHSAAEDEAFLRLAERPDAPPLLRLLVDGAQGPCTIRGATTALVALRAPGTLELLLDLLALDVGVWPMDVADALATLGDARAAPDLARFASTPARPGVDRRLAAGTDLARVRAALALGHLPDAAATAALERGLSDPVIGLACRVALFRLTRAPGHLELLRAAIDDEVPPVHLLLRELAALDVPALRDALARRAARERAANDGY